VLWASILRKPGSRSIAHRHSVRLKGRTPPLVEQFYALQFKLGGVLSTISSHSRTPDLTIESLMKVDFPPIPVKVDQLVRAYMSVVGDSNVDFERLRRLGWSKLRHMDEYLTEDNIDEVLKLAEESDYHRFVKTGEIVAQAG
jgi:hypothetical protein